MRFRIFRSKPNPAGPMFENIVESDYIEFDYDQPENDGFKMPMAHCDQTILHAPGKCQYCDHYPEAQAIRQFWRINFTGENDENKAPCPSEHFRPAELRDRWPGNTPEGFIS